MPSILLFISVWIFTLEGTAHALEIEPFDPQKASLEDVFNTNCLQMTQSQQMLKAYIMKGLNSTFDDPEGRLEQAIPAYDRRFTQIRDYFQSRLSKHPEAYKAFDNAQAIWDESREILRRPPTREGALQLKSNFSKIIPFLLAGTKPVADDGLELLSLTGKLCRGPMKISIDYLLKIWGAPLPDYEADVRQIIKAFHQNLSTLEADPRNDEKSRALLEKARRGFRFFEMMYNAKQRFIPSLLSRKADDNFKIIREIKAAYKAKLR